MKLDEIAKRINEHLKRFERDPEINSAKNGAGGLKPYYFAGAHRAGNRVGVRYVTYQGATNLTKVQAEVYLAWLDAGNVGTHYVQQRKG